MASTFSPRECKLSKQEGQSYGFFLRIEKDTDGHLVRVVEKGSPAEEAGLQDGDRVLRINGVFVDKEEHMQVVDLVRKSGNSVTLLVLDGDSYERAVKKQIDLKELGQSQEPGLSDKELPPVRNGGTEMWTQPRLCYLVKEGNSYGFSLKTVQGKKGVYLTDIKPQGVAMKAGVLADDHLIEVNGENVENASHKEVVQKVKKSGSHVVFLLVDKKTDKHYSEQKIQFKRETTSLKLLPHQPRVVEMKKGSDGYGFYLRDGPKQKGQIIGQIIKDVDSGSPAEEAGLRNDDLVVAVNGESVEALDHDGVVEMIRKGGDKTSLLVVDKETDNLYRLAHFSPFLYYQSNQELPNGSVKEVPATTPASLEVESTYSSGGSVKEVPATTPTPLEVESSYSSGGSVKEVPATTPAPLEVESSYSSAGSAKEVPATTPAPLEVESSYSSGGSVKEVPATTPAPLEVESSYTSGGSVKEVPATTPAPLEVESSYTSGGSVKEVPATTPAPLEVESSYSSAGSAKEVPATTPAPLEVESSYSSGGSVKEVPATTPAPLEVESSYTSGGSVKEVPATTPAPLEVESSYSSAGSVKEVPATTPAPLEVESSYSSGGSVKEVPATTPAPLEVESSYSSGGSVKEVPATTPAPLEVESSYSSAGSVKEVPATTPAPLEVESSYTSGGSVKEVPATTPAPLEVGSSYSSAGSVEEVPATTPAPLEVESSYTSGGSVKAPATIPAPLEVESSDTTEEVDQKPKLCRLVKGENGYGFHLNSIRDLPGSFAKEVQKGSPADLAGLEDEDIIIEVNGVNVQDEPYEKVVDRIQSSGKNVILLVCGRKAYDYFQAKKIPIVSSMADPLDAPPDYKEKTLAESEDDSHTAKERAHSTASHSSSSSEDTAM